jgi:hypothetical protein
MRRNLLGLTGTAIAILSLSMATGVAGAKKPKKPAYCKSDVVHAQNAGYRFFKIKPSGVSCATARAVLRRKDRQGFDLGTGLGRTSASGASAGGWTCKTGYKKPYYFPGVCKKGKHKRIHYVYSDRL